jgi:hypothetical protein
MVGFVSPQTIEHPCLLISEIPSPFNLSTTRNADQVDLQPHILHIPHNECIIGIEEPREFLSSANPQSHVNHTTPHKDILIPSILPYREYII